MHDLSAECGEAFCIIAAANMVGANIELPDWITATMLDMEA